MVCVYYEPMVHQQTFDSFEFWQIASTGLVQMNDQDSFGFYFTNIYKIIVFIQI